MDKNEPSAAGGESKNDSDTTSNKRKASELIDEDGDDTNNRSQKAKEDGSNAEAPPSNKEPNPDKDVTKENAEDDTDGREDPTKKKDDDSTIEPARSNVGGGSNTSSQKDESASGSSPKNKNDAAGDDDMDIDEEEKDNKDSSPARSEDPTNNDLSQDKNGNEPSPPSGVSHPSTSIVKEASKEKQSTAATTSSDPASQNLSTPNNSNTSAVLPGTSPAINPTHPQTNMHNKEDENINPYDQLKYIMVRNDGQPKSMIKLVALKSLFAKQLPKMPRAYIARLVFDRKHQALAILSQDPALKDTDEEVIGSICYRAFPEMRFAEIAFCAVSATHQVKGYGTKLMNLVKQEGARTGIEYFITYADNYAIGYFKKQGFSKSIAMPKGRYTGLIKEYDGGTMMECYVHPSLDYTRIPEMLAAQRQFLLERIQLKAHSHIVYDPLPPNFSPALEGVSRGNEVAARSMAIPGIMEAGWTMADLLAATGQGKDVDRAKSALKSELLSIVRKVEEQQVAWPFREPVDTNEVKDYLDVIKEPIDLSTIEKRTRKGDHYKSKKMLHADLMLMVNNCKLYNEPGSTYIQCASDLEKYLRSIFRD